VHWRETKIPPYHVTALGVTHAIEGKLLPHSLSLSLVLSRCKLELAHNTARPKLQAVIIVAQTQSKLLTLPTESRVHMYEYALPLGRPIMRRSDEDENNQHHPLAIRKPSLEKDATTLLGISLLLCQPPDLLRSAAHFPRDQHL